MGKKLLQIVPDSFRFLGQNLKSFVQWRPHCGANRCSFKNISVVRAGCDHVSACTCCTPPERMSSAGVGDAVLVSQTVDLPGLLYGHPPSVRIRHSQMRTCFVMSWPVLATAPAGFGDFDCAASSGTLRFEFCWTRAVRAGWLLGDDSLFPAAVVVTAPVLACAEVLRLQLPTVEVLAYDSDGRCSLSARGDA